MQELAEQTEETLSFEQICPDFSNILNQSNGWKNTIHEKYVAEDGSTRQIMDGMSCIVGEAHDGV